MVDTKSAQAMREQTEFAAIALGSNMGDRNSLLRQALRAIIHQGVLTHPIFWSARSA